MKKTQCYSSRVKHCTGGKLKNKIYLTSPSSCTMFCVSFLIYVFYFLPLFQQFISLHSEPVPGSAGGLSKNIILSTFIHLYPLRQFLLQHKDSSESSDRRQRRKCLEGMENSLKCKVVNNRVVESKIFYCQKVNKMSLLLGHSLFLLSGC